MAKRGHMTCKIQFEFSGDDRRPHLVSVVARGPSHAAVRRVAREKARTKAERELGVDRPWLHGIFSEECADQGRNFLPHMKKRRR
jgi:hypothetical protein